MSHRIKIKIKFIRAHHSGDLIPGKVLTRHGKCHVSFNGQEVSLANFEVLVNTGGFTWQESSNGHVPPNAVIGGFFAKKFKLNFFIYKLILRKNFNW